MTECSRIIGTGICRVRNGGTLCTLQGSIFCRQGLAKFVGRDDGRFRGTQDKGARRANSFQSAAHDPRIERGQVGIDIGEFGHIRELTSR